MDNNNKTALIICSTVALLIVAGIICFAVWQKNRNKENKTDVYLSALNAINTPIDLGTNIYDVMLSGQRNDSTANGGSSGGGLSSLFSSKKEE